MDIETAARSLADANAESEPSIVKILWFRNDSQIRLVEIANSVMSADEEDLHPFYFSPVERVPYVSAIALIQPEEEGQLRLPEDWGSWESAEVIFDKYRKAA